ncbi:MAG TPA: galactokinase [Acidimicrobiia bacterium]|nr:galactokinase [Acidimicrobiia bacterium]
MSGTDRSTPWTVSVPGRVNLMGDHTDYNRGLVLPMAIARWCEIAATSNDDGVVRARSAQYDGVVEVSLRSDVDPRLVEPAWGRFVAGAIAALRDEDALEDHGVDLVISSTVPPGAGLSSSSALAVALTLVLSSADRTLDVPVIARTALEAEVRATAVPGGLMDQLAVLAGRRDAALLIDFGAEPPAYRPVALPPGAAVLVAHSGMSRTLAGSEYGNRRAECEAIAARLGLASLRDATLDQVLGEPRGRHVVSENARVHAMADACEAGDIAQMGGLMLESHASLRDEYEVSTPELDALVHAFVAAGASGARLTGAGFGGCVVAVSERERAERVLADATTRYRETTRREGPSFVARAVDGALVAISNG